MRTAHLPGHRCAAACHSCLLNSGAVHPYVPAHLPGRRRAARPASVQIKLVAAHEGSC